MWRWRLWLRLEALAVSQNLQVEEPAGLWQRLKVEVSGFSHFTVKNIQVEVALDFPNTG